jgi:hypothetical protein
VQNALSVTSFLWCAQEPIKSNFSMTGFLGFLGGRLPWVLPYFTSGRIHVLVDGKGIVCPEA